MQKIMQLKLRNFHLTGKGPYYMPAFVHTGRIHTSAQKDTYDIDVQNALQKLVTCSPSMKHYFFGLVG